jgi:hypothetical protein
MSDFIVDVAAEFFAIFGDFVIGTSFKREAN